MAVWLRHGHIIAWSNRGSELHTARVVCFHAHFLANPPTSFTVEFPPASPDVRHSDEVDVAGTVVTMPAKHMAWRLTGVMVERRGTEYYEGVML
jgi:hypothetical protein